MKNKIYTGMLLGCFLLCGCSDWLDVKPYDKISDDELFSTEEGFQKLLNGVYVELNVIQIAPLAFMRGRTLNDAVVILDEAQNTTTQQIKMFLTRMGMNTKMIVTGDMTQIDLPSSQTSGLIQALKILKGVKGISFIELNKKDIVRHKLVTRIVEAYEKFEEKQKTLHSCHSERSEKSENIKRIY